MSDYTHLTEEELLQRLLSGEHQFVERKPKINQWDIKQNAVALANSVKSPREGVLFIGVHDKTGKPTGKLPQDLGKAQQDIRGYLDQCYPPIPYYMTLVTVEGQQVIALMVTESTRTPHFTGKAYVRVGDSTLEASEQQMQELVENRLSKVRHLRSWMGQVVTLRQIVKETLRSHQGKVLREFEQLYTYEVKLEEVNSFYVTWKHLTDDAKASASLDRLSLDWDNKTNRPRLFLSNLKF